MEILHLNEVKTWHRVCSLHFDKNNYRVRDDKSMYNRLLFEAIPQNYNIVSVGFSEPQYDYNR